MAVRAWQDTNAEIKLKKALKRMMSSLKIPALLIRSIDLKQISALNDLGLSLPPGDAEIDLMMAYLSGDVLHVNLYEVKRRSTYPWLTKPRRPNKKTVKGAVEKAENQLTKDLDVLMAILAGIPPNQIVFHTLACYPDTSASELGSIICPDCLENGVVCQEDLEDLSLLQKTTKVPDKPDPATTCGKKNLLTLTARLFSHQSLLHIGYRELADQEHLVTERHKYNVKTVDGKMMKNEFVVASPQQQQAIESFNASSSQKHLVLTGGSGTGKTLVALQVANNLIQSLEANAEPGMGPVLLVTAKRGGLSKETPLLKHLDTNTAKAKTKTFDTWEGILEEYGVSGSDDKTKRSKGGMQLAHLTDALAKRWTGRQIVILVDEIANDKTMPRLFDHQIPQCVTLLLVINPTISSSVPECKCPLPESFHFVNLNTPYRSTIAITTFVKFARFMVGQSQGLNSPDEVFGSDVQGVKPIVFNVGRDEAKMKEALKICQERLGKEEVTLLYDPKNQPFPEEIYASYLKENGGPWDGQDYNKFFGWEASKIVVVLSGSVFAQEMISRAGTHLAIIHVEGHIVGRMESFVDYQYYFQWATDQGLAELFFSYRSESVPESFDSESESESE